MKKKIIALSLSLVMLMSMALLAFATPNFDLSVFSGEDDTTMIDLDDDGGVMICINSIAQNHDVNDDEINMKADSAIVRLEPMVTSSKKYDLYLVSATIYSLSRYNITSIEFQIDDGIYTFSGMKNSTKKYQNDLYEESIHFVIDKHSVEFLEALRNHPDDEVKCKISNKANTKSISISLSDTMKEKLVYLYELYESAGGTNPDNLNRVYLNSGINVYKFSYCS